MTEFFTSICHCSANSQYLRSLPNNSNEGNRHRFNVLLEFDEVIEVDGSEGSAIEQRPSGLESAQVGKSKSQTLTNLKQLMHEIELIKVSFLRLLPRNFTMKRGVGEHGNQF